MNIILLTWGVRQEFGQSEKEKQSNRARKVNKGDRKENFLGRCKPFGALRSRLPRKKQSGLCTSSLKEVSERIGCPFSMAMLEVVENI